MAKQSPVSAPFLETDLCVVIPFFNHGPFIQAVLHRLESYGFLCIVIDDGSDTEHRNAVRHAVQNTKGCTLITHEKNLGKGAAVITGLHHAREKGYRFALQIDADGQHDTDDIPQFLDALCAQPNAMILGYPVFGNDAPLERVWGRKLCNLMIWIETGGASIRDGMFGFRIYPIAPTLALHTQKPFRARMGFDAEVVVRLARAGVPAHSLPSKVRYTADGISHYRYVRDNIELVTTHIELTLTPLRTWLRKLLPYRKESGAPAPWHRKREHGSARGLRLALNIGTFLGQTTLKHLLSPVVVYFFLTDKEARRASHNYLRRVFKRRPTLFEVFKHFRSFSDTTVDSVFTWHSCPESTSESAGPFSSLRSRLRKGKGGIILSAHFGALESARAKFSPVDDICILPVMYHGNSEGFRSFLEQVNANANNDILLVDSFGPETVIQLQQRIEQGAYIALLADRRPPHTGQKSIPVSFLGETIRLPLGPFLLAHLLHCDVLTLFCSKDKEETITLDWQEISALTTLSRKEKIEHLAQRFASELERQCLTSPFSWLNFFDFFEDEACEELEPDTPPHSARPGLQSP